MRFVFRHFLQHLQFFSALISNWGWNPLPSSGAHDLLKAAWLGKSIEDGSRVLDVGGGTGRRLADLSLFVRNMKGISIDVYQPESLVVTIDQMETPEISTFDGKEIPFEENAFDVVFVCYVLHHLSEAHTKELLLNVLKTATKRVVLLEDSRPEFGAAYRLRNWAHATESNLLYEKRSADFEQNFKHSFKTHSQWVDLLKTLPNTKNVECVPLDNISKYRHHTMFVVDLI